MEVGQMPRAPLRRAFIAFHLTLGLALLFLSARATLHALAPTTGGVNPHVGVLALVEAFAAVLFLLPQTLRVGGALLLLTLGLATLVPALAGQVRADLLVYAAGTWFVMVHGAAWATGRSGLKVAA
jgi:hypothetical protein